MKFSVKYNVFYPHINLHIIIAYQGYLFEGQIQVSFNREDFKKNHLHTMYIVVGVTCSPQ